NARDVAIVGDRKCEDRRGPSVASRCVLVRPTEHDRQVSEEEHHGDGDDGGVLVSSLNAAYEHRSEEPPLDGETEDEHGGHGERQGEPPPSRAEPCGDDPGLDVTPDHLKL